MRTRLLLAILSGLLQHQLNQSDSASDFCSGHFIPSIQPVLGRNNAPNPRDVSSAAAAALPGQPAAPKDLFWKKVGGLALIFLGGTIDYTILQVCSAATLITYTTLAPGAPHAEPSTSDSHVSDVLGTIEWCRQCWKHANSISAFWAAYCGLSFLVGCLNAGLQAENMRNNMNPYQDLPEV